LAEESISKVLSQPPPFLKIYDYFGGQVFNAKRLYFSPINYPPPQTNNDMSSLNVYLCKGWTKLCHEFMVAAHEHGNPIVCNGSQKSNSDNRVIKCGVLYKLTRLSKAMQILEIINFGLPPSLMMGRTTKKMESMVRNA
jgi:hypothetical protein